MPHASGRGQVPTLRANPSVGDKSRPYELLVGDKPRPYEKAHTTTHLICQGTNNGEAHPATPLICQGTCRGGIYPRLEPYDGVLPKKQVTITELWTDKQFELYLDNNKIQSKPNPYGFIPFVIFPNNREPKKFWGLSDIPAIIQPQRELNRALSQLSRILELSGNPIVVLENVTSEEGIKINPGAVWTLPEDARAMVLNLLEGAGIRLHIDYIDVLYRCLHDISECPRAAYGGVEKELSGTALQIELGSLIQKVTRKRTIRTNAYHRRNQLILRLAEKYLGQSFEGITHRVVWGPILPTDKARQAQNEQLLVQAGVHSRRTAMDEMGVQDPESEFTRWLEEREKILEMNREFRVQSTRGGARERGMS